MSFTEIQSMSLLGIVLCRHTRSLVVFRVYVSTLGRSSKTVSGLFHDSTGEEHSYAGWFCVFVPVSTQGSWIQTMSHPCSWASCKAVVWFGAVLRTLAQHIKRSVVSLCLLGWRRPRLFFLLSTISWLMEVHRRPPCLGGESGQLVGGRHCCVSDHRTVRLRVACDCYCSAPCPLFGFGRWPLPAFALL